MCLQRSAEISSVYSPLIPSLIRITIARMYRIKDLRFILAKKVKEKKKVRPGIWDGDCQECKDKTGRLPINLLLQPLRFVSIVIKLLCTNDAPVYILQPWKLHHFLSTKGETRKRIEICLHNT